MRSVPSAIFFLMDLSVARMVESMQLVKVQKGAHDILEAGLLGAESGGEESIGVVNCGWLEPYWGAVQT